MTPLIRYAPTPRGCLARGPEVERGHTHECIGPRHGYAEHLCACEEWFKAVDLSWERETREARVPDSAREESA